MQEHMANMVYTITLAKSSISESFILIEEDEPYENYIAKFECNDEHTDTYNNEMMTNPFINGIDHTALNFFLYRTVVKHSHWVMYFTDALISLPRIGTTYTGNAWAYQSYSLSNGSNTS